MCKGSQDALDAVVPLGLALAWYEGYTPVCTKSSATLLQKHCAGRFLLHNRRCCTTLAKVRLARNLNSRRLLCSRFTGGKIRRPSLWSKGMVSGSVLFSGRRGCIDQEDDVLFLPLPPCCSTQSHRYTRGKRKTFQSLIGQPQRYSTRQNEGYQNTVS